MTNYTATFLHRSRLGRTEYQAATPAQALQRAREIEADQLEILDFQRYDPLPAPASNISKSSALPDGQPVAQWKSEDLILRLAASDVLDALEVQTGAAQAVIDAWAKGDLAGAVRTLDGSMSAARAAIGKAKGA